MGIVLVVISLGGVFDTVLLETRQRTREMAVLKALGMAPRQVVVMVVSSVVPVAVLAGLLGVPLGIVFQRAVLAYMGEVAAETAIPETHHGRVRTGGDRRVGPEPASRSPRSVPTCPLSGRRGPRIAPVLQAE